MLSTMAKSLLLCTVAAPCFAKVAFTNTNYNVQDGKPFTLTWTGAEGPAKIELMKGSSNNLQKVQEIASAEKNSQVTWTPDKTLPADTYTFSINDGKDSNYSPQFGYTP